MARLKLRFKIHLYHNWQFKAVKSLNLRLLEDTQKAKINSQHHLENSQPINSLFFECLNPTKPRPAQANQWVLLAVHK